MSRNSVGTGVVAYGFAMVLVPYFINAVYSGFRGTLAAITAVVILAGIAFVGYRSKGWEFFHLFGSWVESIGQDASNDSSKKKRAKRPHGTWTSKLIVAVGDQCEFPRCRKTRHLEVHHIDPYAGGGSNRLSNLIVVCPEHHKDFGSGAMNKTRQREYIRRPNRFVDPSFPQQWNKGVLAKERAAAQEAEAVF